VRLQARGSTFRVLHCSRGKGLGQGRARLGGEGAGGVQPVHARLVGLWLDIRP